MKDDKDFKKLEKEIGCTFKNKDLLKQAMVHRSYLNEHRNFHLGSNERLEFLGDAVLELVVTQHLYLNYKNPEGDLTNWRAALVNSVMLAKVSKHFTLEPLLFLSHGESKEKEGKARNQIMANTIESLIGAIYLEHGYDEAKKFIDKFILSELKNILENELFLDPKSKFQETAQDKIGATPSYRVLSESGPDHARHFVVGVYLNNDKIAEGEGTSKHEAQLVAAAAALKVKNWE